MNELRKRRIKSVMKYTWPFYIVVAILVGVGLNFAFGITHRLPAYKTLTLFISGEMNNSKKLKNDLLEKYQPNELKQVTCISSNPTDGTYQTKLSVPGYNTADILIIPASKLENLTISAFGLDLSDELINSYYPEYILYQQDEVNYGIKIDKSKVEEYFTLPNEDCYMILNGISENTGKYSNSQIESHNTALKVAQDWGM